MTLSKEVKVISDFFFYFAFGSNLLQERLHVQIKGAQFVGVGLLKNYELSFFDWGSRWHGAIASIENSNSSEVWGCVWKVPNSFAEELDLQESGYHRLQVPVQLVKTNETVVCRTYQYSNPDRKHQNPSPHYKQVIVSGAIEHELPEDYIRKLKAIPDNGYKGKVLLDLKVLKDLNDKAEI
ncbi:unnamed protein product [Bursaphelenchus xylophilus]|uniref:gamma-glutamylcyclotransferase n=1 Tax=Bursaphelenchus xylophilus TaxID=6326 RepID=A0A1I7RPE1_BURXY|nr:unnamed protein product [Bursaphelenchus xylophilus]CAG9095871.1 unnamed protein product [Bursaphelenchus xylophilus]